MAPIYVFNDIETMNSALYPKSPKVVAKVQQALAAKKVPKPLADKFLAELKTYNFTAVAMEANRYVMKNLKGKGVAPISNDPNKAHKALATAVLTPQAKVLLAKFDLSVHLKGTNLELWTTDCKGAKQVLLTVTP